VVGCRWWDQESIWHPPTQEPTRQHMNVEKKKSTQVGVVVVCGGGGVVVVRCSRQAGSGRQCNCEPAGSGRNQQGAVAGRQRHGGVVQAGRQVWELAGQQNQERW